MKQIKFSKLITEDCRGCLVQNSSVRLAKFVKLKLLKYKKNMQELSVNLEGGDVCYITLLALQKTVNRL